MTAQEIQNQIDFEKSKKVPNWSKIIKLIIALLSVLASFIGGTQL